MSKESLPLEALETIKEHLPTLYPEEYGFDNVDGCFGPSKECQYQLDIIETALKEYDDMLFEIKALENTIKGLEEQIDEKNKSLKALEIIKEKMVDVELFHTVIEDENQKDKLWSYNFWFENKYKLTKEEFDLLKETLC
jgi:hypothetical protein